MALDSRNYNFKQTNIIKTNIMILKDEKLGNYEVHHDGSNYTVVERTGLNKKGEQVLKTHSYCSSMSNAIDRIVKLQVESKNEVYDLKTYLKELNSVSDTLRKSFI
jgi:hypothetical protein